MKLVRGIQGVDDFIDGVKEDPTGNTVAASIALYEVTKVVNIDVSVTQGQCEGLGTWDANGRKRGWHSNVVGYG
jgi:hypothetical protein